MSCHDIGRGMDSVSKIVLDLYEEGKLTTESAIKLVNACRKGVHWCDGNEDEAVEEAVERGYCGLCFKKSEKLTNVYDNDLKYPDMYHVFDDYDETAAHFFLCPDCKKRVIEEFEK
ncbi:MAG: hypothetical protein J5622_00375 [Firmicutes bacterium]|nr:hypothetical protein [Bacillota bacterium]